tara:strand:+ start:386 stop:1006 length:621 start_codon:yes stop_codon:yes gene_type:complete
MYKIKICGITNLDDALAAIAAGADALGFVFYEKSPRYIQPEKAAEIIALLPPSIISVALFVNAKKEEILNTKTLTDFDLIQFHGDEVDNDCQQCHLPYVKAIRVKSNMDVLAECEKFSGAEAILLDAYSEKVYGGSGESFSWDKVPQDFLKPIILAGGLNHENIQQAIASTHCYAVDVSGGVEKEKGLKDHEALKAFCQKAKRSFA